MLTNYLKFMSFILGLSLILASCTQDDINELNPVDSSAFLSTNEETYMGLSADEELIVDAQATLAGHRKACFQPVFPVTLVYPDGSTLEVQDGAELKEAVIEFKQTSGDRSAKLEIQFPHDVELEDGSIVTVESRDDIKELLQDCRRSIAQEKRCFTLVFPVTLVYPDGTTEEFQDFDSLKEALKAWKEANPDADERPQLQYPLDVTDQDGNVITLETAEDKKELLESCRPDRAPCAELVFPVTLEFPDGSTEEYDSKDEMQIALMEWKEDNPDATERPTIQFPQDVELQNGDIITVESADELAELTKRCRKERRQNRRDNRGPR